MKRLTTILVALALGLVWAGVWLWFGGTPSTSDTATATGATGKGQVEQGKQMLPTESTARSVALDPAMRSVPRLADAVPGKAYEAADWPALPSIDLPVLAVFETLRARALKGDTGAACRLTFDLTTCRAMMPHRTRIERGNPAPNPAPLAPRDAAGQLKLLQRCQGLDDRHLAEQYGMLKRSAMGGHELSLGYYLSGELFRSAPGPNIDFLDDYRAEAPRLFEAALQQGSLSAMVMPMAAQFGAPTPFLPQELSNNPFEIESLAIMANLVRPNLPFGAGRSDGKREMDQIRQRSSLSPEQFSAAEKLARQRQTALEAGSASR
ncbi:MAG: hypothetical protein IPK97_14895 [Ahniella sp.]|nr:hypothetical protein [Ahniella sp.]